MNSAVTLNDVCEFIVDSEHKTAPTQEVGYPYIRTPNIGRGRLNLNNVRRVGEEAYINWTKRAVPIAGDLILAREAPVGNVAIVPEGEKVCLGQRTVLLRPNKNLVDPEYLNYLLIGDEVQSKMHSMSSGATVAHLNIKDIRELVLPKLPLIEEQKKLAEVISFYDNLIENNNRRIAILEDMAQSLYREWFVNFRFPGHDQSSGQTIGTAESGPKGASAKDGASQYTKFIDSPLGKIPEGWEVVSLTDIAQPVYGCAFKSKHFNDKGQGERVVRIRDIPKNWTETFTEEEPKKGSQILKNGDLLVGMDGDFHMGKWAGGRAYLNQRVLKMVPNEGVSPYFVYLSMCKPIQDLNRTIVGTTVAHLGDKHIKEVQVLRPNGDLLDKVSEILDPIFKKELNLRLRNRILKSQRDMLLPKLISGAITVSD